MKTLEVRIDRRYEWYWLEFNKGFFRTISITIYRDLRDHACDL